MSTPPSGTPMQGSKLRPQRLDVAHLLEVGADRAGLPALVIVRQFVMRAAGGEGRGGDFGRLHAGQHGVMRALDARHVHEARRAADQRAAGEGQFRHGLPAAFGDAPARHRPAACRRRRCRATERCVLKRWNSSKGDRVGFL